MGEHCEEYGRMLGADPNKVSSRAKKMGIDQKGQVCIMIHSGSRGLGHQVATDALVEMERAMTRDDIRTNDRQLACARINSEEGQNYMKGMSAAANYAWVNRSSMTY